MYCKNGGYVNLILDEKNDDIINITGCYIKQKEILDSISVEDFLNKKDILKYLNKVHSKPCEDTSVKDYAACYPNTICDWSKQKVSQICVALSRKCNLSCVHCGNHRKEESEKVKENYFKILEKIKGYNLETIDFTSIGEPLIYKEELFKYIESLTPSDTESIVFYSNGTLLEEEDILWLKCIELNNKIKISFLISIDGISKKTYEKIRIGGDFLKVIRNIKLLNKAGLLKGINFCVQKDNFEEVEFVFKFFEDIGLNQNQINLHPCQGRDNDEADTAEELISNALYVERNC